MSTRRIELVGGAVSAAKTGSPGDLCMPLSRVLAVRVYFCWVERHDRLIRLSVYSGHGDRRALRVPSGPGIIGCWEAGDQQTSIRTVSFFARQTDGR